MDVTSRELREGNIREAFRGYHHDDVDELLEKAATTIDGLNDRVRQLTERSSQLEADAGQSRETEDMLRRTLLLAQRTADEAVAEAKERARALVEEAEQKASQLVSDAEATARRVNEEERNRLQTEVLDLAARRDALVADVDALEEFERGYRERVRGALAEEMQALEHRATAPPSPRPTLHEVELPPPVEGVAPPPVDEPAEEPPPAAVVDVGPETVELDALPPFDEPSAREGVGPLGDDRFGLGPARRAAAEAPGPGDVREAPRRDEPPAGEEGQGLFREEEPIEAQVLDDDTFFETLREAVRDDTPLGPRDDEPQPQSDLFDESDDDGRRGLFRRRR